MADEVETLRQRVEELETALARAGPEGHRAAEKALLETEARFRLTVEHAPVAIATYGADSRLLTVNPRLCELLDRTAEELMGRDVMGFVDPEDTPRVVREVERLIRGELDAVTFEARLVRRDGSQVWTSSTVTAVRGEAGLPIQGIAVVQDLTPLRQAEQERARIQEQALHAQKLESLGVMAGGIAHDLNNLLCGVLGGADLALDHLEPAHPARPDVELVKVAAEQATEICRQLLAYAGRGQLAIRPVDLSRLVSELRHLLELSVSKRVTLRFELASGLPAVEGDAAQLQRVLVNLVVNASEALEAKTGTILVATGTRDAPPQPGETVAAQGHLPPGPCVYVEVTDSGCGMDAQTQARIFDPFFSTKFAGRGLGLAATLGIVRGHRGAIEVRSDVGTGTTIRVSLPASGRRARGDALAPSAEPWAGRGLVLLADDEPAVRTVGARMLKRLGFEVLVAEDGEQAVRVVRERGADIAAVVLDLTMPKLSGEEALVEIHKLLPDMRVLLTSGYDEPSTLPSFAGKGIAGFLQKPFQLGTLGDKLKQILGG